MTTRFRMRARPFLSTFPTPLLPAPDGRFRTMDLIATFCFFTGSTAKTIPAVSLLPFFRKGILFVRSRLLLTGETMMSWAATVEA